jgi:hypothetical protein
VAIQSNSRVQIYYNFKYWEPRNNLGSPLSMTPSLSRSRRTKLWVFIWKTYKPRVVSFTTQWADNTSYDLLGQHMDVLFIFKLITLKNQNSELHPYGTRISKIISVQIHMHIHFINNAVRTVLKSCYASIYFMWKISGGSHIRTTISESDPFRTLVV